MAEGDGMDSTSGGVASRTVFLSYASHDTEIANTVCRELESRGIRCWIAPRDVAPGALYADAIVRAINESKVLLIVLSQSAVASSHVGRELERAASKGKQIIALRIDTAPLSPELEYFLSNSQWIDVAALGMSAALTKLADAVGRDSTASPKITPALGAAATHIGNAAGGNRKRVVAAAVVIIVAIGAAILAMRFWPSSHGDASAVTQISDRSIAVLPFADMSQKKDQEYFGDGMAEEILDLLAKIPGLTVIGRTSSFQFKGKNEDLRKIGIALNAAYVLEGSVRNSGDQVRITAQLIDTKTGAHEWSETYDRPIGDVLRLQDSIAAAVVRELQLTVASQFLTARAAVKDPEVYDLILRGRHVADHWDKAGLEHAATLFQQALDRDPTSAEAAAELAFTYYKLGADSFLESVTAFEQAKREAANALRLDPQCVLGHLVLSRINMAYNWDWSAAERELEEVTKVAPGSADGLNGKALLSTTLGHWEDALRQMNAALAIGPLDANSFQYLGLIQARRGHLPEAEAAIRRALEIRSTYAYAHYYLGLILLKSGNHDASLAEMQKETADDGKQTGLAIVNYALGRRRESDAWLARLIKDHAAVDAFEIAEVYAFRGQSDQAMDWLERAYNQKDAALYFVKFDLPLASLDADPRFKAFLKKMNLPE
jgi:TolB-like protein/Tfp pilus assembly protein PilF